MSYTVKWVKSGTCLNWSLGHVASSIHTKLNIQTCILTPRDLVEYFTYWITGLVPSKYIKPRYWGLGHMERPIYTKFDI